MKHKNKEAKFIKFLTMIFYIFMFITISVSIYADDKVGGKLYYIDVTGLEITKPLYYSPKYFRNLNDFQLNHFMFPMIGFMAVLSNLADIITEFDITNIKGEYYSSAYILITADYTNSISNKYKNYPSTSSLEPILQWDIQNAITNFNEMGEKFQRIKDDFYYIMGNDKNYFIGPVNTSDDLYIYKKFKINGNDWYWIAQFAPYSDYARENGKIEGLNYFFYHFEKGIRYSIYIGKGKEFDALKFLERFKLTGK